MAQSTVKLGSSGADVTQLQNLLNAAGFSVAVTGVFDAATDSAVRAFQKAKGLVADGVVGPKTWAALTGQAPAHTYNPGYAHDAAFGRQVLEQVWQGVTGFAPNLAELQIAGAQAQLESGYGKFQYKLLDHASPCNDPKNATVLAQSGVINNWGAVQTNQGPPNGFLATDTSPNKKTASNPCGYYDHHYQVYPTPEAGAKHFVEHMTVKRPTSWNLMKKGDIDAWAEQMHKQDPVTKIGLYFEQDPKSRAKGIEERVWAISDALHEPIAAKRGGPVSPEEALGQTPMGEPAGEGGFEGLPTQRKISLGVIAAGLGGLAYTIYRWGWPWMWKIPKKLF